MAWRRVERWEMYGLEEKRHKLINFSPSTKRLVEGPGAPVLVDERYIGAPDQHRVSIITTIEVHEVCGTSDRAAT